VILCQGKLFGGGDVIREYSDEKLLKKQLLRAGVPSRQVTGKPFVRAKHDAKTSGPCVEKEALPCQTGQVKGLGLDATSEALLAIVAATGLGNWAKKAADVSKQLGLSTPISGDDLAKRWDRIRPEVLYNRLA
jgi:hypothetical protein